jgi:DNA-binding GntR family transcriptional regulator
MGMTADPAATHLVGARRQQLNEEVAAYVRELIMSGAVRSGEFLRMERIAEAVGVSNTPVREGLLALSSQGYVRQLPRRGFVVAPLKQQDLRDLFWVQAFLTGELAARAAKKIDHEQLARLEDIDTAYRQAVAAREHSRVVELGHAFHRGINLAADSIRLAMLLGSLVRTLPLQVYSTIEGWIEVSHNDHREILDGLGERDETKTRTLMEDHISGGAARLIDTLEGRGLWRGTQEK